MFKNILLTTAIVSLAAPAIAGGMSEPVMTAPAAVPDAAAPVQTAASDWTGFYAGGQLGNIVNFDGSGTDQFGDYDATVDSGTSYGVHAGYMHDFGGYVIGVELDYDVLDSKEINFSDADGIFETNSLEDNDESFTRLKVRAGYDAGKFLPYATAGLVRWDIESGDEDFDTNGTFFGAGVAFAATENILVGGEILQHQFDEVFDGPTDFDVTTVSLRASYKF